MKTLFLHSHRYIYFFLVVFSLSLFSCTTPKNVAYFQNAEEARGMSRQLHHKIKLHSGDQITVFVNSADPMLMQQFNLTHRTNGIVPLGAVTYETSAYGNGGSQVVYTVDEQGDINFPVIGKLSVVGKTREQVSRYIQDRLYERDLVKDPIVTVEYVNLKVSVLGEVAHPGRIPVTQDYFTILDAIAAAGDLTINGRRDNVMVTRQVDGEDETFFINLCDKESVLTSPAFYLQQNDIIYVTPTKKRQRESNSSGNAFLQPGFWISLLSLSVTLANILTR